MHNGVVVLEHVDFINILKGLDTYTTTTIESTPGDLPNFFTAAFSFLSSPTVWVVTTFLVLLWVPTAMRN
jgi:hypothetical protein